MAGVIRIERVGPLTTVQDAGRFGHLEHGISASGPMDAAAFSRAGVLAGSGSAGIEFSMLGMTIVVQDGEIAMGWDGGVFEVRLNGRSKTWPGGAVLAQGDRLEILAATAGNYGYLRFGGGIDVPMMLGSRATSLRARIGGFDGRAVAVGDVLAISGAALEPAPPVAASPEKGPIRFIWGLHADVFGPDLREKFVTNRFRVSSMMDRMGVRLRDEVGVFAEARILSLVSDPVVVGDIQILGDGTPIVLGRDHQPTGGYPRIGTIASVDLDRFFQLRPNTVIAFSPIGLDHAQALLRSGT